MGVPKFFRYISERYPCLSQLVKEEQIPDFDNLYLDMNGIIHVCSHPDDFDPHFRITEEKIFGDIFHYIEILFRMIKPQKLFFMAVDGVAPRAKMNQQRGRRFRSAKDAEVLEAKARERGEDLPTEARFDSNCITPGTVFMAKLHEQLKYFVAMKISTDYLWQRCKIILSGHNTPGEGEHKIMDYIRYMKCQPGYDPNTRHCLYGLDADLIMLGLCTHEPHFSLLREQVQFGRKAKRKVSPEQTNFYLLHLSLMREYLELEFLPLKESLSFNYDMEKIIDDWVLMGFLVGNDFIPHLPNLHITNGALPVLYNAYMKILPTLDGYINEAGILRLDRFEKFMTALASIDLENFSEHYADLRYYQAKTGRRPNTKTRPNGSPRSAFPFFDDDAPQTKSINKDLEALIKSTNDELLDPVDPESNQEDTTDCYAKDIQLPNELVESAAPENKGVSGGANWLEKENVINAESSEVKVETLIDLEEPEASTSNNFKQKKPFQFVEPSETNLEDLSLNDLHEDDDDENLSLLSTDSDSEDNLMESEFLQHKNDYYLNKLDYSKVTPEVMRDQAEGYVRAIQWNLHYYYNGVCSWSWYYPHHYAPFISDIKGFTDLNIEFELGQPFKPFEQLLAVLPSASKTLLPEPYQELMVSENSPIQQFYPLEFRTDLNGKRQEWEAVVLIPFIAENELLKAMEPCNAKLSEDELKRNEHGPMLVYEYSTESLGEYSAPEYFPAIAYNHAKCTPLTIEDIRVPIEKLVKGPCPGAIHDVYYPGFPSFKHLKYTAYLEKAKVRVFDSPSLNENMIVCIEADDQEKINLKMEATELIDKTIHVAWPHLVEAWVESVSSATVTYKFGTADELQILASNSNIWHAQRHSCMSLYRERWGVDVGDTKVLVQVRTLIGHKYTYLDGGRVSLEKQWAVVPSFYPLQAIVRNLNVHADGRHIASSIQEVFPVGSKCFMLGNPNYGSQAEVLDNTSLKSGRLKLNVRVFEEPNLDELITSEVEVKYMHGSVLAQRLAISPHLLSRITGAVFVLIGENAQIHPRSSNKINIGLNLKYNKRQEEVPGYTKRVGGQWLYSTKALNLVSDYMKLCPELFAYIANNTGNDIFFESDIFPNEKEGSKVHKIAEWLKQQPFSSVERRKTGSECVEQDDVRKLEQLLDEFLKKGPYSKQVIMQVKPRLLYKPDVQTSQMLPDRTVTFKLYDRVANARDGHTVPFGLKGVIVAINYDKKELGTVSDNMNETDDQMFDVVFDQPFAGGLNIHANSKREYRMPPHSLINISHGERLISEKAPNSAATNAWFNKKPPVGIPANNGLGVAQGSAFTSVQGTGTRPAVMAHTAPLQTALDEFNVIFSGLQKKNDSKVPPQQPITMVNKSSENTVSKSNINKSNDSIIDKSDIAMATKSNETKKIKSNINKSNDTASTKPNIATPTTIITKSNITKSGTTSKQSQPSIVQPESYDMTECLRKMLNIGEKTEEKKSAAPVTTKSISVQDMFHAARFKEEKMIGAAVAGGVVPPLPHIPYTVQVLNYWQTHGLGVPRYTYIEHPDHGVVARAVLANGNALVSSPCPSRELAAEDVAHMILTKFVPWWEQQSNAEKAAANQRYKQPTTVAPPPLPQVGSAVHPTAPPLPKVVGGVPPPPPQHTPYTVQVLNYWQALGLGVPKYVYMEAYDHQVVARVELPNGELILSRISPTREQAAEDVARRIINECIPNSYLVGNMSAHHMLARYQGQGPSAAAPGGGAMGFPTPPKQWREPQKNIEKTVASHHKPPPPMASSHHPSAPPPPPPPHPTSAAPSTTNKQKKGAANDAKVVSPNEKKKGASTSVSAPPPFVPLQAVKKQRSKSGSTTGNTDTHRKATESKTKNAKDSPTAKARQTDTSSKKPTSSTLAPGTPTKQRKPRKCRIAANFSALQSS